ncbi:hypothetical protein CHUAL_009802 [Chamberlinius hualienensis]
MATIGQLLSVWVLLSTLVLSFGQHQWKPCSDWVSNYNLESVCRCAEDGEDRYLLNCDYLWLDDQELNVPPQLILKGYLHRNAALQNLNLAQRLSQWITNGSLTQLDLSRNRISKLHDQMFVESLEQLNLRDNLLGDQLNPVFTTESFSKLTKLRYLDLGHNRIRAIDDGLFKNTENIQQLLLDHNQLNEIPIPSLRNLNNLLTLELQNNRIGALTMAKFSNGVSPILTFNLSSNVITHVSPSAFLGLSNLETLDLSHNKLSLMGSKDIFNGLSSLLILDLSYNYLARFPSTEIALVSSTLRELRLSYNEIREVVPEDFDGLSGLFYLDLSANRITHLPPNVFGAMTSLKSLDLRVNLIRKLDQTHLAGLTNLRFLNLQDNNFLAWPSTTLGEVKSLDTLSIGYNRIAAISPQLFETVSHVTELEMEYNLLSEIPNGTFRLFNQLTKLNLRGNRIFNVTTYTFNGIEPTLKILDLSVNELEKFPATGHFQSVVELIISDNNIDQIPERVLGNFPLVQKFDISRNRLVDVPLITFDKTPRLHTIDLSNNDIKTIRPGLFDGLIWLEALDISNNALVDIDEGTFVNLPRLHFLNLANSGINNIRENAFGANLSLLSVINLSGNYLTSFGDNFNGQLPKLSSVDLSRNHIEIFYSESMKRFSQLLQIDLSSNRLVQLDGLTTNCPSLETLILRNNQLERVESGQFGHGKRLKVIDISENLLEDVEEGAFRGSVQIRFLNVSHNRLNHLNEGSFNEMALLDVDISHNNVSHLPPTIFSKVNVKSLLAVRISHNRLTSLPMTSMNEHVTTLHDVDVSHNRLKHVTPNSDIFYNVKRINLGYNPLSENSLRSIFTEPKLVQELNLANCSITSIPALETPFLRSLNLASNKISRLNNGTFSRATLLENLDISNNQLSDITIGLGPIWMEIPDLKTLNISRNKFKSIFETDFQPLKQLETLDMSKLSELGRLGHEALKHLSHLRHLAIYGYPRLGFYDVQGLLESLRSLESLKVEIKGNVLRDQLQPAYNSRLTCLSISGDSLNTLTSVSLAGLVGPMFKVTISGTNITQIPNALFLPLPMSSRLQFNVANNRISTLGSQLLAAIDEKKSRIQLAGVDSNPIRCDCNLKSFHRWIIEQIVRGDNKWRQLSCHQPEEMTERLVWTLQESELSCEKPIMTTAEPPSTTTTTTTTLPPPTTTPAISLVEKPVEEEPDIIYEAPATKSVDNLPNDSTFGQNSLTNMDSMIIGIIVGVVAFVCILIIIICILKLRHTNDNHRHLHPHYPGPPYLNGGPTTGSVGGPGSVYHGGASSCTCISGSNTKELMMNGQMSHPYDLSSKLQMATMNGMVEGRQRHHRTNNYYVAYPDSDNGCR